MDLDDLLTPRYQHPDVLAVTGLTVGTLQTWLSRRVIELSDHHPGRGKSRQYCVMDVVKLAVMRRLFDFRVGLAISADIARAAAGSLLGDGLHWDDHIVLRADNALSLRLVVPTGQSRLLLYGLVRADPALVRLDHLLGPDRFLYPRRPVDADGTPDVEPVDPAVREHLAEQGIVSEPALVFPVGECVLGTLAQLRALDART